MTLFENICSDMDFHFILKEVEAGTTTRYLFLARDSEVDAPESTSRHFEFIKRSIILKTFVETSYLTIIYIYIYILYIYIYKYTYIYIYIINNV